MNIYIYTRHQFSDFPFPHASMSSLYSRFCVQVTGSSHIDDTFMHQNKKLKKKKKVSQLIKSNHLIFFSVENQQFLLW